MDTLAPLAFAILVIAQFTAVIAVTEWRRHSPQR
jgi:hypothetical protein